ncbi:MAG: tRNA preQ1(34) S-adenosylmethionine ribosyltransferase-isomerase QueA [Enterobacterales bacterium]|nr:tRNA preQ1(34) S-adenosylmethionine ribosyltransferase-isomerase QueA [Enterobacterales bacterium]
MQKSDFKFELPNDLIAAFPCANRSESRLLLLDPASQSCEHKAFYQLVDFLQPEDCLIFNNTKVIPARLYAEKETGGKVEILLERFKHIDGRAIAVAQIRASNTPKIGAIIKLNADIQFKLVDRDGAFFLLENLSKFDFMDVFESFGQMPLPPYIERRASETDKQRYQTVYAKKAGAVAAPTAGLHFDQGLIDKISQKGINHDFVTLHVGAGTFSPVRGDDIKQHQMHTEWYEVPQSVVDLVETTRHNGGRVIAVGTTSVRCLESASRAGKIQACHGETDIFITPGYQFQSVDALITNFHLSESTLIMLVSAFAGHQLTMTSYATAIKEKYRFFSYGDSMFIQNKALHSNNHSLGNN